MDEKIEQTIKMLKKHSFAAEYAKDKDEARDMVMKMVPEEATVGIPGSASVRAAGIADALKERGNEVFDHWEEGLELAETMKIRKQQLTADVLITSANALSMTGEIVNMDGVGNRVAPTIWGPSKVIFVVGKNKIAEDLEAAKDRIRNLAAPVRAKELSMKTPCVDTGECTDCNVPQRVCRVEVILHRKPSLTNIVVIVVDEQLGN